MTTGADLAANTNLRLREVWAELCARDPVLADVPPPVADDVIDALRAALDQPRLPGLQLSPQLEGLAAAMVQHVGAVDTTLAQLAYLSTAFELTVLLDLQLSRRPWANSQLNTLIQRFMIAVARAGNAPRRRS